MRSARKNRGARAVWHRSRRRAAFRRAAADDECAGVRAGAAARRAGRPKHVVVGHDFHYSRKRAGTVETLRERGHAHGFRGRRGRAFHAGWRTREQFAGARGVGAGQLGSCRRAHRPAVSNDGPRAPRPATRPHARLPHGKPGPATQGGAAVGNFRGASVPGPD